MVPAINNQSEKTAPERIDYTKVDFFAGEVVFYAIERLMAMAYAEYSERQLAQCVSDDRKRLNEAEYSERQLAQCVSDARERLNDKEWKMVEEALRKGPSGLFKLRRLGQKARLQRHRCD